MPIRLAALAGAVLSLTLVASAPAATFCVEPRTGCDADGFELIGDAIEAAEAAAGDDRVLLGLATYAEPVAVPPGIELAGLGRRATVIEDVSKDLPALSVAEGASARGFDVQVADGVGVSVRGVLEDAGVLAPDGAAGVLGLGLLGTARRVEVRLPGARTTGASGDGFGLLEDATVLAQDGVVDVQSVRRVRVTATETGIQNPMSVDHALVLITGQGGTGIRVPDSDVAATVRHATVSGGQYGLHIERGSANGGLSLVDSAVTGSVFVGGHLRASHSAFVAPEQVTGGIYTDEGGNVDPGEAALFVTTDPAEPLAFRPRHDSVLRNAGTPGELGALESATDLAGDPRIVEDRRDIGAFEYQDRAPGTGFFQLPPAAAPGQEVTATVPDFGRPADPDGDPVEIVFDWGDGSGDLDPTHAYAQEGRFTVRMIVKDAAGNASEFTRAIAVSAGPTVFCVAPRQGCAGGDFSSVADALAAALGNGAKTQDRIELGEATYGPIELDSEVVLAGLGPDLTAVVGTAAGAAVRASAGTRVEQLTALAGDDGYGVHLSDGARAADVAVRADRRCTVEAIECGPTVPLAGVWLGPDARAVRAAVDLPASVGVVGDGPGTVLEDSRVSAQVGVRDVERVSRTRIAGGLNVQYLGGVRAHLDNLLLLPRGDEATAIANYTEAGDGTLVAQHVTILGDPADAATVGVLSEANAVDTDAASLVELTSSLIRGVDTALLNNGYGGQGVATDASIAVSHSSLDVASQQTIGIGDVELGAGNIPLFAGDLQDGVEPLPGSPLIDAGEPLAADDPVTDLLGRPRVNGAAPDIGAVEHQGDAPAVTISGPATALTSERVTFTAAGRDPDPGDALSYAWSTGDSGATLTRSFGAGTHTVTVTVTDLTGRTATASATVVVTAPAAPAATPTPAPTPPAAAPPKDLAAPRLGKVAASVRRRRPTFTTTLTEAARVTVEVERKRRCRRVQGRRRCTAAKVVDERTVTARAGKLTVRGRRLPRGSYVVRLVATDAAGNDSRRASRSFRV